MAPEAFKRVLAERRLVITCNLALGTIMRAKHFPVVHWPKPQHIWYPTVDTEVYELRDGNAPADSDRPIHLRGLDLWIDCARLGPDLLRSLHPGGLLYERIVNGKALPRYDGDKARPISIADARQSPGSGLWLKDSRGWTKH
jgi:hypothetical protein